MNIAYGGQNSGLFKRAIISSGSAFGVPLGSQSANQRIYDMIAESTGCFYAPQGSLQCLREGKIIWEKYLTIATNISVVPFEVLNSSIAAFYGHFYFSPIADGEFLRNSPTFAFDNGLIAPVDIITGCTTDEGMSPALSGQTSLNTTDQVSSLIQYVAGIPASLAAEWLS